MLPPSPRAVPQFAQAPAPRPAGSNAGSRTRVLGAAALLVVSGLAIGVYWTLQSRDDDAAKPAAPAASAVAAPASAAAAVVSASAVPAPSASPALGAPEVASASAPSVAPSASATAAPAAPPVAVEATKPVAIEPATAASSPRREPAVAASAPPRPRREPARVEPPVESRPSPGYPSEHPSAKGGRCSDILQKGSLEPLTAEEAAYLKRECR
jgi:hypothetical protein